MLARPAIRPAATTAGRMLLRMKLNIRFLFVLGRSFRCTSEFGFVSGRICGSVDVTERRGKYCGGQEESLHLEIARCWDKRASGAARSRRRAGRCRGKR